MDPRLTMTAPDLKTERCLLGPCRDSDRMNIIRLLTDGEVRKYLGGPVDSSIARLRAESIIARLGEGACWAVRARPSLEFIGLVTLAPYHEPELMELSYMFLPECWGNGFATEATKEALAYATKVLCLDRIVSETQVANSSSCRLLERLGMRRESTLERFGELQALYSFDAK